MKIIRPGEDLQSAVNANQVVQLAEGTFLLDQTLVVPTGTLLIGSGPSITTLKRTGTYPYAIIQNNPVASEWITIEDLSIDCGGASFLGINLFGSHNCVRNVHVHDHVSPPGQESFAILLSPSGNSGSYDCLIEGCVVSDFRGNYDGGLVIASGTSIPIEGTIRNCKWYGNTTTDPFDFVGVMAATVVEGCYFQDVAIGVYTEGLPGPMIVRNNTFRNVRVSAIRVNLLRSQEALYSHGNHIHLNGGAALSVLQNALPIDRLDFFNNTISGGDGRCELAGAKWKRRNVEAKAKTKVGTATLEGDWKKFTK